MTFKNNEKFAYEKYLSFLSAFCTYFPAIMHGFEQTENGILR